MKKKTFNLYVPYSQIFVQDNTIEKYYVSEWNEEEMVDMLSIQKDWLVIGTVSDMLVPFVLEIVHEEPIFDRQQWDQIVKCSIEIQSGILCLSELENCSTLEIELPKGLYGVLICYGNLDIDGHYADENGMFGDHYQLTLWKVDKPIPKQVIKYWANNPEI